VATILGHASGAQVDRDLTLLELGFDSLTAVLLRNQVQASLGIDVPIGRLLGSATVESLTQLLQERLAPPPAEQVEVI
jgi:acyl carrier protein